MRPDPATVAARKPAALLRAARTDDLAVHHDVLEPGPGRLTRAALGVGLGLVVGVLAAVATPRPRG